MRKTVLWVALVLSLTVGLAACKKDCTEHVDEDTNLACDVCGEAVTKEEETTEAPCTDHVDADIDEACDKCGEFVEYVPTEIGFEGLYNGAYEPETERDVVYAKAELVSALKGLEYDDYSSVDNLLFFRNDMAIAGETKLAIVNANTGNVVLTLTQEEDGATSSSDANVITCYGSEECFICVTTMTTSENGSTTYSSKLYTALGAEIMEKKSSYNVSVSFEYGDLYVIDGKVYEVKDGVATYKRDKGLGSILYPDYSTDKNHYIVNYDEVFVYDLDYKMVAYYAAPAGATSVSLYPLADGNVFVQYRKELPWDAAEYDLYEDGSKYDLGFEIFNITDQSVKTLELDFWVEDLFNSSLVSEDFAFGDFFVSEAITNCAMVYPIVDKSLDESHYQLVNIRNDMFILNELKDAVLAQESIPLPLGSNRFLVIDKNGLSYLVNEKGTVLGDVSDALYDANLKLFFEDGRYYDLDLKPVFDENDITYNYIDSGYNYTLYSDVNAEGKVVYYIQNGATLKQIDVPENASIYTNGFDPYFRCNYYVEQEDQVQYFVSYYNAQGEKIYTVETSAANYAGHSVAAYGDILVIRYVTYNLTDEYYDYSTTVNYYIAK